MDYIFNVSRRKQLKALETVPKDLPSAYKDVLLRIEASGPNEREIANRTLLWLFCSRRPLTMPELCEALGVEDDDRTLERQDLPTSSEVIESCQSLVMYDETKKLVRFTHYTVQEFIAKHVQWSFSQKGYLAKTCLTYLLFDDFSTSYSNLDLGGRSRDYKFSLYASQYWGIHTRDAETCQDVQDLVHKLLYSSSFHSMQVLGEIARRGYVSSNSSAGESILHISAKYDLATISGLILTTWNNEK